ncbi:MAG TPA: hypothetical protein VNA20_17640 [Frankiaceae bacterium]|nr:hypothetical protein [Frankiaceae bacterium]
MRKLVMIISCVVMLGAAAPGEAASPFGGGVVTLQAGDFFRPWDGFATAATCTYDGFILSGTGLSATVPPGYERDISLVCDIRDVFGRTLALTDDAAGGPPVVAPPVTYVGVLTPEYVCGKIRAWAAADGGWELEAWGCERIIHA